MGINRTLKYKRNKRPSQIELVDKLIGKSLDAIKSGRMKVTVADWIRLIHLRRKLYPETPSPGSVTWVDRFRRSQLEQHLYSPPNQELPELFPPS
jgi:hypothetical protein